MPFSKYNSNTKIFENLPNLLVIEKTSFSVTLIRMIPFGQKIIFHELLIIINKVQKLAIRHDYDTNIYVDNANSPHSFFRSPNFDKDKR